MPDTPILSLPYPVGTDPADGPGALQALAEQLEDILTPAGLDVGEALVWDGAAWAPQDIITATELTAHEADTIGVHGIADTAALYRAGGTDVAVADGGTGASTAAGARTNLGAAAAADAALTGTVTIDGDVNLYRAAENILKTDDTLQAGGLLYAAQGAGGQVALGGVGPGSAAGVALGAAGDVSLYRADADTLRTPDRFQAANGPMLAHDSAGQKIVSGIVNADGTIATGSGFTVTKGGAGDYTINFTNAFSSTPPVNVTPASALTANAQPTPTTAAIRLRDTDGAVTPTNERFAFVAIGAA